MKPLKVGVQQAGQRLDSTLSVLAPELSRSSWQALITNSKVTLNGKTETRPAKTVKKGDTISAELPVLPASQPDVPILYEDDDVVVFDKPAGMLTHAKGELAEEWTLADIAKTKVQDDPSNRPGIVHRLDRATSGVIIVAKNISAKQFLQKQFANRKVEKTYRAIVRGRVEEDSFLIDMPIARDFKNPQQFAVNTDGKTAQTAVNTIKSSSKASLLKLTPKTGRTHQLRVHLKSVGHPIIGDVLYGSSIDKQEGRLYLHASRLKLVLPGGSNSVFESELPDDFKAGVNKYGLA